MYYASVFVIVTNFLFALTNTLALYITEFIMTVKVLWYRPLVSFSIEFPREKNYEFKRARFAVKLG
jgi:hypothetical protein